VAKAGVGLAVGYAIATAGGLLSLMAYARVLGPHPFGQLAVYLAIVEAVQAVLFQWHRLALVRLWTASPHADADSYLVTSHIVWLVVACGTLAVVFGGLLMGVGNLPSDAWLATAVLALAKSAALYTQEMARATSAVARYAIASILLTVGATGASIVMWSSTRSLPHALYAAALVFALQSILCGFDRVRVLSRASFSKPQFDRMLRYGLPLVPVFLATTAMTRLDRPILAAFVDPASVGVYAAASGLIVNAVSAVCLLVVTPCYPWLLREMSTRSIEDHRAFHARLGLLMLAGVFALSIALLMLGDIALPLMLGPSIGTAAVPLVPPLLGIAIIASLRAHFFDQAYHLHARTKALMGINFLTLALATLAIYLGARANGCNGVLLGLLVANFIALICSAIFARSFVDTKSIVKGISILMACSAVAMSAGYLLEGLASRVHLNAAWSTVVSATAALGLFSAMYLGCNVGQIRHVLRGQS
jgi:O-antigen/teichoic acid export membrane protein